jgi:hypothetical protein
MTLRMFTPQQAATFLKVSRSAISEALNCARKPSKKLLAAMGWERVVTYRPIVNPKRRARNE